MSTAKTLVERLRACADDPMWADHAEIAKNWCSEAADEIERLAAAKEQHFAQAMANGDSARKYRDEAERMRAALTLLASQFPTDFDMKAAGWGLLEIEKACNAYDAAREALAAPGQG